MIAAQYVQRWAARVEYLGCGYAGWQRLSHAKTVQGKVEAALSKIANAPVSVVAAGRTDSGVHGLGQVIHFDAYVERSAHAWLMGCNSLMPNDISMRWVQPVALAFHARFKAVARRYRYVIHCSRSRSALTFGRASFYPRVLDAALMHQAAQCLVGEHDFSSFRASECQSHTASRTIHYLNVWRSGEFVVVDIQANAFLHHMVRNIVGSLIPVGEGSQPPEWLAWLLVQRSRKLAGKTVAPEGLTFVGVIYPDEWGIPSPPEPYFPATMAG